MNVLVPIDFSETSYNALRYALKFNKELNFSITCIHSYTDHKPRNRVKKLNNFFNEDFDIKLIKGDLFSAFREYSDANKVDFIIMGTKGVQGLKKIFIGSNAKKIMLQTNIPLLIIPDSMHYKGLSKIVWASDFKPLDNPSKLNFLKDIALATDSSIRVAHVITDDKKDESEHKMHKSWEDKFLGREIKHSFKKIRRSSVSKGIQFYLDKKDDNDLLVLIRRQCGFLNNILRRSQTEQFASDPKLPVLILHE